MLKNDPRKIKARFGKCAKCGKEVKGKEVYYFPLQKSVYCLECGQDDYNFFLLSKEDESFL